MDAKKASCSDENIKIKDSEADHDDHDDHKPELGLSLEKLNLAPKKIKKKLLVMNLNGFLLHRAIHRSRLTEIGYVNNPVLKSRTADQIHLNFLLFKRPFSEEFMKFCLERFEVGIWTCAKRHNVDGALTFAIGEESKNKLLFVWDQIHCRNHGFKSLENKDKPLFFKELKNVWEKVMKGGPYSASNTLMIDDKPYKAFLNPSNTAIFVKSYDIEDKEDNALDPNGDLCKYLKGLAEAENVQSYVKDNAFGVPTITSSHPDWSYYNLPELGLSLEKINLERKKKLLIMNLNGFLLHRVHVGDKKSIPKSRAPDYLYLNFYLYKRPFSHEFMKFCLERFEVGIWSSARKCDIDGALRAAVGELTYKLLFVWDQKKCKETGYKSLENNEKPIYFKELKKVWEDVKRRGPYSASNTLMIDDKPYKAFFNPHYTSIFTKSYDPENKEDNELDPNGELCEYLKGVYEAEDVQSFVRKNGFGEPPISSSHPQWNFYSRVRFFDANIRTFR